MTSDVNEMADDIIVLRRVGVRAVVSGELQLVNWASKLAAGGRSGGPRPAFRIVRSTSSYCRMG